MLIPQASIVVWDVEVCFLASLQFIYVAQAMPNVPVCLRAYNLRSERAHSHTLRLSCKPSKHPTLNLRAKPSQEVGEVCAHVSRPRDSGPRTCFKKNRQASTPKPKVRNPQLYLRPRSHGSLSQTLTPKPPSPKP